MRGLLMGLSFLLAPARADQEAGEQADAGTKTLSEAVSVKRDHPVVAANTLWDLAAYYYEDPLQWPRIYEANKDRIKDPHWIYPGQVFVIPGLDRMVTIVERKPAPAAAEAAPPPEDEEEEEDAGSELALVEFAADKQQGAVVLPDSLSVELPPGMAGQQPAMYRMKLARNWKPDGTVVEFKGRESMTAAGDYVSVRLKDSRQARRGRRYVIFRKTARTEADVDLSARYVQKVGILELVRRIAGDEYRARILASGGSVLVDDMIKQED